MSSGVLNQTYRVAEALPKDVGRGLARLDPKDMAELGVEIGDVIEVTSQTDDGCARHADPCRTARQALDPDRRHHPRQRGGRRGRAGVSPARDGQEGEHDRIGAERCAGSCRGAGLEGRYLTRLLDGMPVVTGDRVRVNPIGTQRAASW